MDANELLSVCCYVDPTFKSTYIEDSTDAALVTDHLTQEGVEMI